MTPYDWKEVAKSVPVDGYYNDDRILDCAVNRHFLTTREQTHHYYENFLSTRDLVKTLVEKIEKIGFSRENWIIPRLFKAKKYNKTYLLIHPFGFVLIDPLSNLEGEVEYSIHAGSPNQEVVNQIKSLVAEFGKQVEDNGSFSCLVESNDMLQLKTLTNSTQPLVRENYDTDTLASFDYVVEELNKDEPNGRVILLNGPAGGGKSHIIEALSNEVKENKFILIPPSIFERISSPDFLSFLLDQQGKKVLILEDADLILAKRSGDNNGVMAALLNFSDGIFGKGLNIRFVATTNLNALDIDPAITRNGRLCRQMTIKELSVEQSRKVLKRLNPDINPTVITKPTILADLYALAYQTDTGTHTNKKSMGFAL